jgi:CheY-like chemotaxis protein
MPIVWNTVNDHNGHIQINSERNYGTTFELYFPATDQKEVVETREKKRADISGSGELILVVDDVSEQREISTLLLTRLGYSVSSVPGGKEAIEYIRNNDVDLMILDMIMAAGMDGLDTYREISKLKPGITTLIASGYTETSRVKQALSLGVSAFIRKPFTMEEIGQVVKDALSGGR